MNIKKPGTIKIDVEDKTYGPGFELYIVPEEEMPADEYRTYLKHVKHKEIDGVCVGNISMFSGMEGYIKFLQHDLPVLQDTLEMYIKHYFTYEECSTVKELRYKSRMRQKAFAEYFGMPLSTLQKWEQGVNQCPDYVFKMMKTILSNQL
ncbi:MAG: hypothetical protein IJP00_02975 [Firmicutes bacterium]|nr:hypothetical protein [Bacillota bacterium]